MKKSETSSLRGKLIEEVATDFCVKNTFIFFDMREYIQINKEDNLYNSAIKLIDNNKSNYIDVYDCYYITIDNDTYYYKNNDGILQVDSDFYDVLNRNFILQLKARRTG